MPTIAYGANYELPEKLPFPQNEMPKKPLRIYSTSKGDKLTMKTYADGSMTWEWEAKDDNAPPRLK